MCSVIALNHIPAYRSPDCKGHKECRRRLLLIIMPVNKKSPMCSHPRRNEGREMCLEESSSFGGSFDFVHPYICVTFGETCSFFQNGYYSRIWFQFNWLLSTKKNEGKFPVSLSTLLRHLQNEKKEKKKKVLKRRNKKLKKKGSSWPKTTTFVRYSKFGHLTKWMHLSHSPFSEEVKCDLPIQGESFT